MVYNTKQRKILLEYFKSNQNKCLDIKSIYDYMIKNDIKVGLTTIYRYLNDLVDDNTIKRYSNDNKGFLYSYQENNCQSHYHLKCLKCNKIIHLDCEIFEKMKGHIKKEHKFILDDSKLVLYGICKECQNNEENN